MSPDAVTTASGIAVANYWEQAFAWICHTVPLHVRANIIVHNSVIGSCSATAQWRQTLSLQNRVRDRGNQPDPVTANLLLSSCGKMSRWGTALRVTSQIAFSQIRVNIQACNSILSACGRGGHWWQCVAVLADMARTLLSPDIVTYNSLMTMCQSTPQWMVVHQIFHDIQYHGLQADRIAFNSLLAACGSSQQWEAASSIVVDSGIFPPRVDTVCMAMNVYGEVGRWQSACRLLYALQEKRVEANTITYNSAIDGALGMAWKRALVIFGDLVAAGLQTSVVSITCAVAGVGAHQWQAAAQITDASAVAPCNALMAACGSLAQWQSCLSSLQELLSKTIRTNAITINSSIAACGKAEKWQQTLQILADSDDTLTDLITFNAILDACSGNAWQVAIRMFQHLCSQHTPDLVSYNAVIASLVPSGNWRLALALAGELPQRRLRANRITYSSLASVCGRIHQWQIALTLLEQLTAELREGDWHSVLGGDVILCSSVLSACELAGRRGPLQTMLTSLSRLGRGLLQENGISEVPAVALRAGAIQPCLLQPFSQVGLTWVCSWTELLQF
ncbi:unnamed protein product [Symbiodinium necroappetens]|uniref:Pentatricopeptide repeat-containing protein, chloroplastic n=1 Tax=Symbiodinium necroappetens TaxID=1628268 RepID=A0A812L4A6_9DINO|nr:unnamed protein product [Symbiodinium necroappetens]